MIDMLESELDSLEVKNQSTRDFILQQVGLKILNLLLHAVKQRENVDAIAVSELELDRNEQRIKKEVRQKAIKELRIFYKRNKAKISNRQRHLDREYLPDPGYPDEEQGTE